MSIKNLADFQLPYLKTSKVLFLILQTAAMSHSIEFRFLSDDRHAAKPWQTEAQGNTPPTAQTAHTAREGGADGNGGNFTRITGIASTLIKSKCQKLLTFLL